LGAVVRRHRHRLRPAPGRGESGPGRHPGDGRATPGDPGRGDLERRAKGVKAGRNIEATGTITELISLGDQGTVRSSIPVPGQKYDPKCDAEMTGPVETCDAVAVGDRRLYVATQGRGFSAGSAHGQVANAIVAFDLATGKSVRKFDAKVGRPMYPVRMSGDRLIAYRESFSR